VKPFALLAAALLAFAVACQHAAAPPPDHPRLTPGVRMQDVTFRSVSLQRDMPYRVILPSNSPSNKKLATVYLLHGGGGDYRDWSNYSDVTRFAERGFVLVMPEGNSSYYMNAAERQQDRYEDYITRDLISEVEKRFPVPHDRANRALVGISMGGFGAVTLALKHPDLYVFVGGLSSAVDVPSRAFSMKRIGQYRAHAQIFGSWGSATRQANDPYFLAQSDPANMPYLYLTCGDQEGLLPANRKLASLLQQSGFKYEFHAGPGGHDWNQWNQRLPTLFESLEQHLGTPSR
jgi:putative tributyrin esterase